MAETQQAPRRRARRVLATCLMAVLALLLIEGLCSFVLFFHDVVAKSSRPPAERRHTRYDEELGWVNIPGTRIEDLYAPGCTVTINAQGFRGTSDTAAAVSEGRIRIVCSGDSLTFGYGVGDDDTWCAQLATLDPRLEVVNMGQGGYGFDQAYLWYLRDGVELDLDVHLFAINVHDLDRMTSDRFLGFGKPTLTVDNGRLVAGGVPVSEASFASPWATENAELLRQLGIVDATARLTGWLGLEVRAPAMGIERAMQLAHAAVRDLAARHREQGSAFVFAFLPASFELTSTMMDDLRLAFVGALRADEIPVIDLVEYFRTLPLPQAQTLFLGRGEVDYPGAEGHFSEAGNWEVAQQLWLRLRQIPQVAARLGR